MSDKRTQSNGPRTTTTDPQVQLRMLTENIPHNLKPGWYPFDDLLSRSGRAKARAADVPQRLGAQQVLQRRRRLPRLGHRGAAARRDRRGRGRRGQGIRLGLRRLTADKDDQGCSSRPSTPSPGLRPWREVLAPHDDVATGNFQAAEFAADLYKVAREAGRQPGLRRAGPVLRAHLPHRGPARPDRPRGARLRRGPERLAGHQPADQLRRRQDALDARAVAPGRGRPLGDFPQERPGPARRTPVPRRARRRPARRARRQPLRRLGRQDRRRRRSTRSGASSPGSSAERRRSRSSRADETRTPPGEALHDLLECLRPGGDPDRRVGRLRAQLVGRDDLAGGTFDDQFTFAQSLTEAVKGTPGVLLAISIPASETPSSGTPTQWEARGGRRRARCTRRSSGCRTSSAASPTSGGRRPPKRPTTSSASGCSSRRRRSARVDQRDRARLRRDVPPARDDFPARRARAATRTGSSRPTRSTLSCSTASTRTGRASSASSARAASCG